MNRIFNPNNFTKRNVVTCNEDKQKDSVAVQKLRMHFLATSRSIKCLLEMERIFEIDHTHL